MSRRVTGPANPGPGVTEIRFSTGLRVDETIYIGGQADLGVDGTIRHPGDLEAQVEGAADRVETALTELDADVEDVAKLAVFYASRGEVDEAALLGRLRTRFPGEPPPACMAVPLPALALPGQQVVVECIAMRGPDGRRLARQAANPPRHWPWPFSHGLRCREMLFVGAQAPLDCAGALRAPGQVVEQAKINIRNIAAVMAELGGSLDDVCRFNTFYVGHGTAEDWKQAGQVRGNAFERPGVCGTGVPVPALYPAGLTIRQEATGMLGLDGSTLPRTPSLPEGHWDWPIPVKAQQGVRIGSKIMIGGQVSADAAARAVHPDDLAAQTRAVMDFIKRVVEDLGGTMADIVKLNSFYKDPAGADPERLYTNLSLINERFETPGPVVSCIPLRALGMERMDVEIEAYAVVDRA